MAEPARVPAAALTDWVAEMLRDRSVPEADAALVAGLMVEADVRGYPTHGVFRLRQYLARLEGGGTNPTPRIRPLRETAATALIDGDDGLGHLAMSAARDLAMSKAREAGIGWVGVRRCPRGSSCSSRWRPFVIRRTSSSGTGSRAHPGW